MCTALVVPVAGREGCFNDAGEFRDRRKIQDIEHCSNLKPSVIAGLEPQHALRQRRIALVVISAVGVTTGTQFWRRWWWLCRP
jgi:hypothetical protein